MDIIARFKEKILEQHKVGQEEISRVLKEALTAERGLAVLRKYLKEEPIPSFNEGEKEVVLDADLCLLGLIDEIPSETRLSNKWFLLPKGLQFGLSNERRIAGFSVPVSNLFRQVLVTTEISSGTWQKICKELYFAVVPKGGIATRKNIQEMATGGYLDDEIATRCGIPLLFGTTDPTQVIFTPFGIYWIKLSEEEGLAAYPREWHNLISKVCEKCWSPQVGLLSASEKESTRMSFDRVVETINHVLEDRFLNLPYDQLSEVESILWRIWKVHHIKILPRTVEGGALGKRPISWLPNKKSLLGLEQFFQTISKTGVLKVIVRILFDAPSDSHFGMTLLNNQEALSMMMRKKVAEDMVRLMNLGNSPQTLSTLIANDWTLSPIQALQSSLKGAFYIKAEELPLLGHDNNTFAAAMLLKIAGVWYCVSQEARMRYVEVVEHEISRQIASLKSYGASGIFEGGLLQLKFTRSFVKYVRLVLAGNTQAAGQIDGGFFKDLLNN